MVAWIRNNRARLWAIGEVGLDFWIAKKPEDRDRQTNIFSMFVDLSLELDLPLNVHSRSAGRHVIDILLSRGAKRVQLHAFDGKFGTALVAVEAGFLFSIPPSVARSRQKQKLVRNLPLSCQMVESDSPVLGPEARERNEPANTRIAIDTIAHLKGETVQTVAITGLGDYGAPGLTSREATATIGGSGSITVHVTERLVGTISGRGWICYLGDPTVQGTVTGLGTIGPCGF